MSLEEKSYEETPRTDIKATIGEAGATVKDGVLSGLKGISEIETQIVTLIRNTVSDTLKATGSMAVETVNVTKDVLQGTSGLRSSRCCSWPSTNSKQNWDKVLLRSSSCCN